MAFLGIRNFIATLQSQGSGPGHMSSTEQGQVPRSGALARTIEFWTRAGGIYLSYKACQLQELAMRTAGCTKQQVQEHWDRHHEREAQRMYQLCVDLRGFYLKARPGVPGRLGRGPARCLVACRAQVVGAAAAQPGSGAATQLAASGALLCFEADTGRAPCATHETTAFALARPLQTGQFIGARGDFIPEQICRKLALLQDQVPPMPAAQAREVRCVRVGRNRGDRQV